MATLLELSTLEAQSTMDPGDPEDAAIVAARGMRAKVRVAVLRRASVILSTALPTDASRSDALELLGWAQRAVENPEPATATVFRLALVKAPAGATISGILAATDQTIEDGITPLLALLAKYVPTGNR